MREADKKQLLRQTSLDATLRTQIEQVGAKEHQIQVDLKACMCKLLNL